MAQLLALPEPPDAVFSASDFSLVGALQTLKAHGIAVPQQVALAGFSNEAFTCFTEPMLTTVDQHCEQMGRSAIRLLLEIMAEQHVQAARSIVLQPALLVRSSSKRRGA